MKSNREEKEKPIDYLKDVLKNRGLWQTHHARLTQAIRDTLAIINSYEHTIFELENRLKECENGYEGTLYLDRCKLHDAEEKIRELAEANKRLNSQVNRLKKYDEKRDIALHARLIDETRANTASAIFKDIEKCRVVGSYGMHYYLKADIDELKNKYKGAK